ncbi:uncharacterized protein LOC131298565 [Rhododendron vialii]|uniref:uncharacterized protein LOC131298565 n=1 Tax=Rhododendron vialii TaxID=182163 RepID=UPI00265F8022|nr:uncharacterized protein LOC131298565 [Rhododendron vialii]
MKVVAKAAWDEVRVSGWAGFVIMQKLKGIKDRLRVWNKEDFEDINSALQEAEAKMHHFDTLSEVRQLNDEEKALRCSIKSDYWRLSKLSESLWKQKSRVKWLKLGDRNTRSNKPLQKKIRNNFKEDRKIRPVLGGFFSRTIESAIASQLEKQFEEKEILVALQGCSSLKAPGPDGFNFSFVKKGWDFMKESVTQFFTEFHANGKLTKEVLSKVLANRIKEHMRLVIGESQATFVCGKQILDGVLIANEAIHS